MEKMTKENKFRGRLIYSVWVLIFGLITYILYCYIFGLLYSIAQMLITIVILITILTCLFVARSLANALIILLIVCNLALLITWGNVIPFVQFLPFITTYFMLILKKERFIDLYLILLLIVTTIELSGLIPVIKDTNIEVGTPNLVIILVLQLITFSIWRSVLQFYSMFDKVNTLGLNELMKNTTKDFLLGTLAKGLYVSILFHFFNNFLNSIVWGAQIPDQRLRILRIFSESDRDTDLPRHSIMEIFKIVDIHTKVTQLKSFSFEDVLTASESKLFFLLLYNVKNNYQKYCKNYTIKASRPTPSELFVTFTSADKKPAKTDRIWSRNLGSMKQLLQLTHKGNIEVATKPVFTTILTFSINEA